MSLLFCASQEVNGKRKKEKSRRKREKEKERF